jgi:hypothetical protein
VIRNYKLEVTIPKLIQQSVLPTKLEVPTMGLHTLLVHIILYLPQFPLVLMELGFQSYQLYQPMTYLMSLQVSDEVILQVRHLYSLDYL